MVTEEKKKMVYIGIFTILFAFLIGTFIDGYVCGIIIGPLGGDYRPWWGMNGLIMIEICVIVGATTLWADPTRRSKEDYMGAVLVGGSPIILAWSSLSDIVSACWIELFTNGNFFNGFYTWFWNIDAVWQGNGGWWWCDWTLAGFLSKLFGYEHTQFWAMLISSVIGVGLVIGLWLYYYDKI